jgi:hypothetical protein
MPVAEVVEQDIKPIAGQFVQSRFNRNLHHVGLQLGILDSLRITRIPSDLTCRVVLFSAYDTTYRTTCKAKPTASTF